MALRRGAPKSADPGILTSAPLNRRAMRQRECAAVVPPCDQCRTMKIGVFEVSVRSFNRRLAGKP
jgi:hypothetical protein